MAALHRLSAALAIGGFSVVCNLVYISSSSRLKNRPLTSPALLAPGFFTPSFQQLVYRQAQIELHRGASVAALSFFSASCCAGFSFDFVESLMRPEAIVEKDCPACGEKWGFVQWSVFVTDNPPKDWKSKIGRVEF